MAIFKQAKKLFGNNIEPACLYCLNGVNSSDSTMILCKHMGVVSPYFSCKKFIYEPTKRIPKPILKLPDFDKEDFSL